MTQVRTSPTPERQQPCTAGAGRGSRHNRRPVCISPYPPHRGGKPAEARLRTRIDRLLQAIDMPRCRLGSPVWEEKRCLPQPQLSQAQRLGQPSFVIAELCSRIVFTTWGDIYEAPRRMWLQAAVEGGAAWN